DAKGIDLAGKTVVVSGAGNVATYAIEKAQGEIVALIKPQFEAGRENVGKKGVVRDAGIHEQVIREIVAFSRSLPLTVLGMTYSPVKGPEGNIEYLLYLTTDMARSDTVTDEIIGQTVAEAHRILN
ncbi:MAG: SAM-dependent methyltransferase, partial [Negativicutes bacterium]